MGHTIREEEQEMSLMDLFRPSAGRLRAPEQHEEASITTVLLHMPTPRLARIANDDLSPLIESAISDGGGILQIGLAPSDLEIEGDRFAARCDLRLTTPGSRLEVRIEGSIDSLGMVEPKSATLISRAA